MKKQFWLFTIGGTVYYLLEVLWKGNSHWSMFVVGGVCFRSIGAVQTYLSQLPILLQCGICGSIITLVEFISGWILNVRLQLSVWDYTALPFNLFGQICLPFTILWSALSFVGLHADRLLNTKFDMRQTKPQTIIRQLHRLQLH